MQALYQEKDYTALNAQIRRRQRALVLIALLVLAAVGLTLALDDHKEHRPELLTTLLVIFGGGAMIFFWDLMIRPLRCYARHMHASLHGRSHEETAVFERFGEEVSLVDGVRFRDLIFLGSPDKHGDRERLYYWDAELPLPDFQPGQSFRLTYYDRFLTGYEAM